MSKVKSILSAGLVVAVTSACVMAEAVILVQADRPGHRVSRYLTGACIEDVNHEIYGGLYSQMIFGESFQEPPAKEGPGVSGMWRQVRRGNATGQFSISTAGPFVGTQCQHIAFEGGEGELGVENQGLNHWGMCFVASKPYEGVLWARAGKPAVLVVALESGDGTHVLARQSLEVKGGEWQRLTFTLQSETDEKGGRFSIVLTQPGEVDLGYVFMQPGPWGRFKGLPVRRDVVDALIDQGITVLRYGGSMVNHAEYRWKKMIGPRDRRVPYRGTWYTQSTNGWGIVDFLDVCEAAGFLAIPAFNMGETPQDMTDFIEYVNGPATSEWGGKRAADGHPAPYNLQYLELGNEERVDDKYFEKFKPLAEAIWAKDAKITLVVGDFVYSERIVDPFKFGGAASGITSLAGQASVLKLARQHDREVWFDLHVGTEGPRPHVDFAGMLSFRDALERIADGARHKVVVFEFNSDNHTQRRALANAMAIAAIERDGRIPIATSANCLQPDGQNDNGWDQGLLFLNPSQVWLQPPGYVTRMISRNYQPLCVPVKVSGSDVVDVSAKRSEDNKTLVLQIVNVDEKPQPMVIRLDGFVPSKPVAMVEELAGPLTSTNTASEPNRIVPRQEVWTHGLAHGEIKRMLPACSFTVIRLE